MRLIRDGIVDRDGVKGLAQRLGFSERHLHRLMTAELGAGPLALAQAQRSQTARTLLETSTLSITDIAFASGFSSVRQFNDTIRYVFDDTPSGLRSRAKRIGAQPTTEKSSNGMHSVYLRLPVRRPFQLGSALEFLSARSLTGVESTDGKIYCRSIRLAHGYGIIRLTPSTDFSSGKAVVHLDLQLSDLRDLQMAVDRCRQLLDLDADAAAIFEALHKDPVLGALVTKNPGLRVLGTVDGFELATRAIVGQQVSVLGARTIISRLVLQAGEKLTQADGKVTHLFPTPSALLELASSHPEIFSMPGRRRRALAAVAQAVEAGTIMLDIGVDRMELRQSLEVIPGIGRWTSEYVAMRVLRDPDAFMPTDLGITQAVSRLGITTDSKQLAIISDRWRPWRSYAMAHLWSILADTAATPRAPSAT